MKYNKLGKSDLKISRIGFGCMSLKGEAKDNKLMIDKALELGVNFFDTADLYNNGANEELITELLKSHRNEVIVATKAGNQARPDGSGWDWNPRKSYILAAVEKSLKRLKTDRIDLYQLHGGTIEDPIDETIEAFELLKEQGKIRYYGISSIRPNVIREYVKRSDIVSVMMQYSLLDRRPAEECFDLLKQHDISILSRGGLAQGLLVDKPAAPYLNWSAEAIEKAAAAVQQLTGDKENAAQTAIRYVLQDELIASAVIGIRTLAQLEAVASASDLPAFTETELAVLNQAVSPYFYSDHR